MNIAAIVPALLMLAGAALLAGAFARRRARRVLAHHVEQVVGARRWLPDGRLPPHWRVQSGRAVQHLFAFGSRSGWAVAIAPQWLLLIGGGAAALTWIGAGLLLALPQVAAVPLAAAALLLVPRLVVARQRRRLQAQFTEAFPDAVDMVVRMIRAGLPVAAAVGAVGEQAQPPVASIFRAVADQGAIGIPLEEALTGQAERLGSADFRFFAVAVALQRSTGGNLAVTLETLADIIRRRRAVRLKGRATSAEVRLSAYVLGGIPPLIALALSLMSPAFLEPLLNDPTGNVIFGAAIVLLGLAGLSMRWLSHQDLE